MTSLDEEIDANFGVDDGPCNDDAEGEKKKQPSQADTLIKLAAAADLIHTPGGDAYALIQTGGHRECWPVRRKEFRRWLIRRYYRQTGRAPNADAMQQALGVVEAMAQFDAQEREVFLRRAEHDGCIYIDLGDAEWQAIEVDKNGWRIVPEAPVLFRRPRGMLPLPVPERGGDLDLLAKHVNVAGDDLELFSAWILAALRPRGPYPALVLAGEPGSAKSTAARRARDLVDPHAAPLRTVPRSEQDLWVSAQNAGVVAIDNLSWIPGWLSDGLCRLATGGGFASRELYSDSDEAVIEAVRPSILTGIADVATRPDLADRSILLTLDHLPDGGREEALLEADWRRDRPYILGALLDRMVHGLRHLADVDRRDLPRMADFAAWTAATEYPARAATDAYLSNRRSTVDSMIENDAIAGAITRLLLPWTGTAGELLAAIERIVPEQDRGKHWPRSPRGLTARLRHIGPALRAAGVDIEPPRQGDRPRRYSISEYKCRQPSRPTQPTEAKDSAGYSSDGSRRSDGPTDATDAQPTYQKAQNSAGCDGPDGSDGWNHTHSETAEDAQDELARGWEAGNL